MSGNSSQNPGLPLTENQKNFLTQIKEGEKKRAAAAKTKAEPSPPSHPPKTEPATTAAVFKRSATTAMWAQPCNSWTNKGTCSRGISCRFAHQGFPVSENRCITCGKADHSHRECTAPGGGQDPNRDAVWDEYRKRKEANAPAKKGKGKGKDTDGKGKVPLGKVRARMRKAKVAKVARVIVPRQLLIQKCHEPLQRSHQAPSHATVLALIHGQMCISFTRRPIRDHLSSRTHSR